MTSQVLGHQPPSRTVLEAYTSITDATYTAKAGDRFIGVNRSGTVTITLPTAEVRKGRVYTIKDESGAAATNNITVDTEGSQNIDGSATDVIDVNYESKTYYSDGTNWFKVPAGLHELLDDTTPQLGGDLDANSKDITGIGHVGFLATQDPSAGANDLDDYEEGTWTIGLTFGGGNTSMTSSSQAGRYTKWGNRVNISGDLLLTAKGTSTGSAKITGLPFTSGSGVGSRAAVILRLSGVSYNGFPEAYVQENTTNIILAEQPSAGGGSTALNEGDLEDTTGIIIGATYDVG